MKRRTFLQSAAALAATPALATLGKPLAAQTASALAPTRRRFPDGFVWGTATAAYQVEGAVHEDGRGPSIWDTFSHTPGKITNGDTGDVADDFYHRFPQDIALMQRLGCKGFRFSIAWPRIFPQGTGTPNQKGVDFYKRLVDALHAAGIEPYCTLFHWDLPQALEDKGGWASRDTTSAFADYVHYTAGQLSDRISHWMTINEFGSYIDGGYSTPWGAPGRQLSRKDLAQTKHYAVLAHGLAVQAVRSAAKGPVQVGLAEDVSGFMPAVEDDAHIHAAQIALREGNAAYTTVVLEGRYTEKYLRDLGADAPHFTPEELKIISSPLDFWGLNCYTTQEVVPADTPDGYLVAPRPATYPHMSSEWLFVAPPALYWTPKLMTSLWDIKKFYITENGCSSADVLRNDGPNGESRVLDTDRVQYLRSYLENLQRAAADGIPVAGYFLWSLLDNYEWSSGYSKRFGITYVDYATQKRTPKLSSDYYRQVIANNAVI